MNKYTKSKLPMSAKNTSEIRQEAIVKLLKERNVSDQNQLVDLLAKEYSIQTNQAVVSRDLRKLGVVKRLVNGISSYELPDRDVTTEILRLALLDIVHNETMIVIKTHPGLADFVGDCVDQYSDLHVLGCLSGENVVFVTPVSIHSIATTYEKLCKKFQFKPKSTP